MSREREDHKKQLEAYSVLERPQEPAIGSPSNRAAVPERDAMVEKE
jgi:hypothetical protein